MTQVTRSNPASAPQPAALIYIAQPNSLKNGVQGVRRNPGFFGLSGFSGLFSSLVTKQT
jgi:hypothetical protein